MTACAWCGAPLARGVQLRGRVRCAECGVATTLPWPTPAELARAYGEWYRPPGGRFGLGDRILRFTRGRLAARLERIAPPGPVLDVGAGDGTLVAELRRRGRKAAGLDPYSRSPEVRVGELADEEDGVWAAVIFWHSLEHLREPAAALAQAARALAPKGVLVVAVPNSESLQARLFGDRWLALDLPRHLVHLTSHALRGRLLEVGFAIERVSYLRGGQVLFGWLHGLVSLLPGHPSLYEAIRRPQARSAPLPGGQRLIALLGAVVLLPLALLGAATEVALRRGGTVYVEARLAG